MMELVDMRDLGSRASRRWGSSPHARTKSEQASHRLLRLFTFSVIRTGFDRRLVRVLFIGCCENGTQRRLLVAAAVGESRSVLPENIPERHLSGPRRAPQRTAFHAPENVYASAADPALVSHGPPFTCAAPPVLFCYLFTNHAFIVVSTLISSSSLIT